MLWFLYLHSTYHILSALKLTASLDMKTYNNYFLNVVSTPKLWIYSSQQRKVNLVAASLYRPSNNFFFIKRTMIISE